MLCSNFTLNWLVYLIV
uniref:Uncharacterized protein n=1 Tax=Rhizophora mucronata TaxID=61149 RepID=A0A2P2NGA1_RHIMU